MLVRDVPSVLTSELYAIPALVGAAVTVAGGMGGAAVPTAVVGAGACFVIRMLGVRYALNAPARDLRA